MLSISMKRNSHRGPISPASTSQTASSPSALIGQNQQDEERGKPSLSPRELAVRASLASSVVIPSQFVVCRVTASGGDISTVRPAIVVVVTYLLLIYTVAKA